MIIRVTLFATILMVSLSSCITTQTREESGATVISTAEIETPDQAIAALKAGNDRFVAEEMASPNVSALRREQTLNSQKPFAAVVACSDSRVPVELLFDSGIGDIFVIRTAGNSVADDVVMGSVDYAIDHLNVPLVVVLGHQNCGGVTSTITVDEHAEGEEHHHNGKIAELLAVIRQDVEPYVGHPEMLDEAIHVNADAQVERLKSVKYIDEKIESGRLKVVSAYYSLEDGRVTFE